MVGTRESLADIEMPSRILKHVIGVQRKDGMHFFPFNNLLRGRTFDAIQTHDMNKGILIFETTRKVWAGAGIGFIQDGMDPRDREAVEKMYREDTIRALIVTPNVGNHLRGHYVVINGVQTYKGKEESEYDEVELMQMVGCAVRSPSINKEYMTERDIEKD
ncbi:hypothetical protein NMY22_g9642 [Coprinellus aureogranulatus]|nr:hypothetical protein NMY22_g9642 [Coprinellus aureogranulatus]